MNKNSSSKVQSIELLAPAKNLYSGIQAINCGADAIYIASDKFGLRNRCGNTLNDIKKLTEYAHKYWVKVYVTLNSLIYKDSVFEEVKTLIDDLYNIGVDAIIISDMGILMLDLPPIPIYASVNTRCFSPEKINFFEKVGIKRVILPRELSLKEYENIAQNTNIELEAFVHGTFCVAISGNCYLKFGQNIKNSNKKEQAFDYQLRSSNNGACIANCSDIYSLLDSDGNYIVENEKLLNLRYLNLLDDIEKLIEANISSFKIEGRQREISYVKNITALFNDKINEYIKNKSINKKRISSGICHYGFIPSLNKTFNRGFTNYFFNGKKQEMLSISDVYGEYVGVVKSIKETSFELNNNKRLYQGDSLVYRDENSNIVKTINIINSENKIYTYSGESRLKIGDKLYRTVNSKAIENIENAQSYRKIQTNLTISNNDLEYLVEIKDSDNNNTSMNFKNTGIKNKKIVQQIEKVFKIKDSSEFLINQVELKGEIALTKDEIINIKNIIYKKLREEREKNRPREKGIIKKNDIKYPLQINSLDNITNSFSKKFYQEHGVENPILGIETSTDIKDKPIFCGKYCIKYELGYCSKKNTQNELKEPLYLEDKYGNKYKLAFDCDKCEMQILG